LTTVSLVVSGTVVVFLATGVSVELVVTSVVLDAVV